MIFVPFQGGRYGRAVRILGVEGGRMLLSGERV